jgi:hypothetical protein
MSRRWQFAVNAAAFLVGPIAVCAQCGFAFEPVAAVRWYRSEGWTIPGLADAKAITPTRLEIEGKPVPWDFPEGVTAQWVQHNDSYRVTFPAAIFERDGQRTKMLAREFILYQMVRWEVDGKPYAYSYLLGPLDVACSANIDIIDENGDGVFRVMTPNGHTLSRHAEAPPLPGWAKKPKT